MKQRFIFYFYAPLCLALLSSALSPVRAAEKQTRLEQHTRTYSVGLGATRLVYTPGSPGVSVAINNPNDFPILAQSEILTEENRGQVLFSVTPPLFRLDAGQQSRVRIIMTGEPAAKDRESLNWLCVTGIPPEKDDVWNEKPAKKANNATLNLQVKLRQCIKLFTRPAKLSGSSDTVSAQVTWYRDPKGLRAVNNSPYFINIKSITVGDKSIKTPEYIKPFSNQIYAFSSSAGLANELRYVLINDSGGESAPIFARIK